jgi:hypothetical protein
VAEFDSNVERMRFFVDCRLPAKISIGAAVTWAWKFLIR